MEARDIIIRPLITEKSTALMAEGKYVFEVAKAANKIEIAKAVSEIFKVKVEGVNTINVTGKVKRMAASLVSVPIIRKQSLNLLLARPLSSSKRKIREKEVN